ncbi:procollagen C-endopeptidase enhancer 1 [Struthio camelus]|uniref:procollagen C-endopeptidase enhancer 1 n=1 Tax=Struthio camelus TaxID=8801 RepID=UPI003603AF81
MSPGPAPLPLLLGLCALSRLGLGQGPAARANVSRPVFLCGGEHSGDSGYIASEGFPAHYPPNRNCTWTITVPEGQVVMLSFRVFDLEPDPLCRFDALSVYAGAGAGAQLLGRFCGTFRPGALLSTGNRMLLRMESDEATAGRGFLVWFSAGLPHVDEHQFCGGKLEKPQGGLKTPNWPEENYPAGISCSWHIVAPKDQVIELTFGKFDVEPDTYCRYDYVAVFDGGDTDDSRRLGKFCGEAAPGPIVSAGNELLVQFVSDLSVTADGFSASYAMKSRSEAAGSAPESAPKPPPAAGVFPGAKPKNKPPPGKGPKGPGPTAKAAPEPPTAAAPAAECPQRCRRTGTMQSNFCASDFVLTGTVKTVSREAGAWAAVSVLHAYKLGGLSLPQPAKGAALRLGLPCRHCPGLKKGASYVLMGRLDAAGAPLLPPDAFVVPFRPQQHQILGSLSKRPCRGQP